MRRPSSSRQGDLMMSRCALSKLDVGICTFLFAAGLMTLGAPSSLAQTGAATTQTPAASASVAYVPTMTFVVASVRENGNIDPRIGIMMSGWFVLHTTTFRAINWDIKNLISNAYGVDGSQIMGAPNWPPGTVFVIEAKGDSEENAKMATLTDDQQTAEQQHMMQALLEERFNLKTHWETREADIYHLVVAKGGPKLSSQGLMPPSADELKNFGDHPIPSLYQKNDGQGYDFIAHGCSMDELVTVLTSQFGRPVIDKTGLTGKYDFVLKYKGRWDQDRPPDDMDPMPPIDRALTGELGLKVEAARGPKKVLVIDHIDKPSPN
jgi:uncharacterized protein (TIGR03435 family)